MIQTMNDTRTATVEVHLEGEDGIRLSEKRNLRTISIRHAADLTRFLHEGCSYANSGEIRPEDFGTLTFAELNHADLGPWNRADLDLSIGWVLDDLLELVMDDGWDVQSTLRLIVH